MNAHTKLKSMGFKRTTFHRPGYSAGNGYVMLPDLEETKTVYNGFKAESIKVKKIHPKSNSFYVLKYNENYTLWASIVNHTIDAIWLEDLKYDENKSRSVYASYMPMSNRQVKDRITLIYDYRKRESYTLTSKTEIINMLPKDLRRDYLISQLFG